MNSQGLRLNNLATFGIAAFASTCTVVLLSKRRQDQAQALVADLNHRHANEKADLQVRLINEKLHLELQVIELNRALSIVETTLAMQTRVSGIHEQRIKNHESAHRSCERLIEMSQEHVKKLEDVVAAGKLRIAALDEQVLALKADNVRTTALEQEVKELQAENVQLLEELDSLPEYRT